MERRFTCCCTEPFTPSAAVCPACGALGLGAGQPKLLWYLAGHGPAASGSWRNILEIDPAAAVPHAGFLGKGGFVARSAQQGDRRADVVRLTEKGGAACAEWQECCRALERKMLPGLRAGRRSSFRNIWPAHTATCAERVCGGLRMKRFESGYSATFGPTGRPCVRRFPLWWWETSFGAHHSRC